MLTEGRKMVRKKVGTNLERERERERETESFVVRKLEYF